MDLEQAGIIEQKPELWIKLYVFMCTCLPPPAGVLPHWQGDGPRRAGQTDGPERHWGLETFRGPLHARPSACASRGGELPLHCESWITVISNCMWCLVQFHMELVLACFFFNWYKGWKHWEKSVYYKSSVRWLFLEFWLFDFDLDVEAGDNPRVMSLALPGGRCMAAKLSAQMSFERENT